MIKLSSNVTFLLQDAELDPIRFQLASQRPQLFALKDPTAKSHYVVKFLSDHAPAAQQVMFRREIEVLQQLNRHAHPNLMQLHHTDVGQLPAQYGGQTGSYFVMPYAQGGNLSQHLKVGLDQSQIIYLLYQVITAVDQLHQCGWLHLDIKPSNFLLSRQNTEHLLLTDFALARLITVRNESITTEIQGTPAYMSPEQFQGVILNEQTDYYALGLVCYELLTGQHPFHATTYHEWALAHCQQPVPLLKPPFQHFQPLIDGLLAKDRQYRVGALGSFIDLLKN